MMAIDEAGQDDMVARAEHLVGPILLREQVVFSDLDNHTVALEHGAIFHDVRLVPVNDAANDILAADE